MSKHSLQDAQVKEKLSPFGSHSYISAKDLIARISLEQFDCQTDKIEIVPTPNMVDRMQAEESVNAS